MIDKLRTILRKKYPNHTPEQLEYEIQRRLPDEEVEEAPVVEDTKTYTVLTITNTSEDEDGVDETNQDDLTNIRGIGKKLQEKLNNLGIVSFKDIATLDEDGVERVNDALDFKGRIDYEQWIEQAKEFME